MNSKLRFIGLLITVTLFVSGVVIYGPTYTVRAYHDLTVVGFILMFIVAYIAFLRYNK
ncbi:MAG: hypothetical protein ACE5K4_09055 [Candidatus Hydrothermarchaeota archaeon]